MRISFIEPHLKIFGGIRRILELSNHLIARGHEVTIFHSDGSPCHWMHTTATTRPYEDVLRQEHEILIFNDPNPNDFHLANQAKARLKVYYVLELYEMALLQRFSLRLLHPKYRRTLYTKASLASPYLKLANASWLVSWLKDNLDVNTRLLLGGVNQNIFHPIPHERNSAEIRILCSGDPRPRKGTDIIYEAFHLARKKVPELVLDTYHGQGIPQDQMATKYASADIFVDAQRQAGWNNPVAEAMACGVPVVCTDIGGVQDFAFHEETALLVPIDDSKATAAAIIRLAKDRKLRDTLSRNAYAHITQFDWSTSAETLERVIETELSVDACDYRGGQGTSSQAFLLAVLNLYSKMHWMTRAQVKRSPLEGLISAI